MECFAACVVILFFSFLPRPLVYAILTLVLHVCIQHPSEQLHAVRLTNLIVGRRLSHSKYAQIVHELQKKTGV